MMWYAAVDDSSVSHNYRMRVNMTQGRPCTVKAIKVKSGAPILNLLHRRYERCRVFLTACSSQTWSGFLSIMMDDPVTHFDELNTYALLDLILGLQSSSGGERQFVISTCDEKLLQLARHKFRHLGTAAKFYRFQAIGPSVPMVSEISA